MADKTKSIKEATDKELDDLILRLRKENEAQDLVGSLMRKSTRTGFEMNQEISTEAPVESLYHKVEDILAHYGVLGMKWGVRKDRSSSKVTIGKKKLSKKDQIKLERKQMARKRRTLSDEQIKKSIDRLQNEKKLKELVDEDVAPGRKITTEILKKIGTQAVVTAGTAVATYAIKAAMEGKFDIKEAAKFIQPKKK